MKEQNKAMASNLSGTNISSMSNREFKAMTIRLLTGLEKRVQNISETLTTDIRKTAEIKGSINQMRNILDGEEQVGKSRGAN